MKKLSIEEKQLLLQLIKSCEFYHLNEKQSIECVTNILNRSLSRRTYYNYKCKLYSHDVLSTITNKYYYG
jgi:hypothetical protein